MARPRFVIVAGPNGCGKSTVGGARAKGELGADVMNVDLIDADYAKAHPAWPREATNLLAAVEAERRVWKELARGKSVAIETVLSTDKYLDAIDAANRGGYETIMYYVTVDSPQTAVQRIKARVAMGGHHVPESKVRDRWIRSHRIAAEAFSRVGRATGFDNSGAEPVAVALSEGGVAVWTPEGEGRAGALRASLVARGLIASR